MPEKNYVMFDMLYNNKNKTKEGRLNLMNKKNVGLGVGLTLLGCGAVIGAVCAKKYYTRRKRAIENYNVEVDRLQNEVDFDYSEDFLKELKKESLKPEKSEKKKSYSKDDLLKVIQENKNAIKEHVEKLENIINEYIKKEKKANDDNEQMVIEGFDDETNDKVGDIKIIEHVGPSADEDDFEDNDPSV